LRLKEFDGELIKMHPVAKASSVVDFCNKITCCIDRSMIERLIQMMISLLQKSTTLFVLVAHWVHLLQRKGEMKISAFCKTFLYSQIRE